MDSWPTRKRAWEEYSRSDVLQEENHSSPFTHLHLESSYPPIAARSSPDDTPTASRRLPPLHTPAESTLIQLSSRRHSLAGHIATGGDGSYHTLRGVTRAFEHQQWPQQDHNDPEYKLGKEIPDTDRSLPPIETTRWSTNPQPPTPTPVPTKCCTASCGGQACVDVRILMRELASELVSLDDSLQRNGFTLTKDPAELSHINISQSLRWAVDFVRHTNSSLRDHIEPSIVYSPERHAPSPKPSPVMRRAQYQHEGEEQSPSYRQIPGPKYALPDPSLIHPRTMNEDNRRNAFGADIPGAGSPHTARSPSVSSFMRPPSPLHAPQNPRNTMLPSASSMKFPTSSTIPPISSPTSSLTGSAQSSHLQDLQHQISVKTLAFQTLQREYDSLLQKLERQRTKCTTLEKKFEVSDVEINSLSDEKERLQSQVITLEAQVEELQESRDEARRSLMANGTQYMRIMEMANRLQVQNTEDRKRWDAERTELEQRIKVLEEAMVTGDNAPTDTATGTTPSHPSSPANTNSASCSSHSATINVLRAEIVRLRARTQSLEIALQTMKDESISIQAAARQLVASSGKIEEASHSILDGQ
ncbi:hypothetical protein BU24DRAFT_457998 [Aaosphaeria arxii CBS 175.79]|uniref:Uncharacterized protein n=1 Tax=Aaosphaeria arxii CBS 175.79 TaxID=1450172 RepID=A0A6A5Y9U8_9PLEO|nr:uncharacterized protein BU24DRAFT_457998 [Aaosphaeria arxii CBS 175.79]KAF2022109.1 hypothetical protein BU24DRAFT_457998 [Aaosphaeria arxii CBS 175.79]